MRGGGLRRVRELCPCQAAGGYKKIAGYEPRSTVEQHANIDKDGKILSPRYRATMGSAYNCDGNNCKWHADTGSCNGPLVSNNF